MITKPYPAWIDSVPYTPGFSQPDFKMFDGTGDPHPHLAHFLVRCGPVAQNGALCLRLFVQSLGGPAFTWYAHLSEESIPTWEARVTEFIARWRAPTFSCPQKFTQQELLKMCMNNFRHDLSSILLPQTFKGFDDLCTKAHDVEAHLSKRRRPTKYLKFVPLPY
uniref:Retrotransposon gag domain-containing protein n=1 Tax=Picea glauca TaxID=3330 RepID=A0A101LU38_PICGL|nr:hypothetical protein ABT39_MTgene3459 [Picea glauca]